MQLVLLSEFVEEIYEHSFGCTEFLCHVAYGCYGPGGKYVMVKLLEEEFPGRCYGNVAAWRYGQTPSIAGIMDIASLESIRTARHNLIHKWRARAKAADYLLCVPDVKGEWHYSKWYANGELVFDL